MLVTFSVLFLAVMRAAAPAAGPGDLQATLAKLDAASARFTSAEAKVKREAYTALIKETETTQGTQYVIRSRDGKAQLGLKTDATIVEYKDATARVYNVQAGCFNTVNKPGLDSFLSLGFGGSGKDLAKAWDVTDQGSETLDGVQTEKLDLVPKDPAVKNNVTHITVWMDLERDVTLKLVLFSPSRDTNTATFSDIRLNKHVDTAAYAFKGKACH